MSKSKSKKKPVSKPIGGPIAKPVDGSPKEPGDEVQDQGLDWSTANRLYLDGLLQGLFLRLHRRIHWLRQNWQPNELRGLAEIVSDQQVDWLLDDLDHRAEEAFYERDKEAARLTMELAASEKDTAELLATMQNHGMLPALGFLAELFGLTGFEQQLLLMCLTPELDPAFAELYAYIQDSARHKYATLHLALALFPLQGAERQEALNSLMPDAPLNRWSLLRIQQSGLPVALAARPLSIDERIADYIRGVNRLPADVANSLGSVPDVPLSDAQRAESERLAAWLREQSPGRQIVNLWGGAGAGKGPLARAVCQSLGLELMALHIEHLPRTPVELIQMLKLLAREAALSQLAYYIDLSPVNGQDQELRTMVETTIDRLEALLFLSSEERWPSRSPAVTAVPVTRPNSVEQLDLWRRALGQSVLEDELQLAKLIQQFDFGPGQIVAAITAARRRVQMRSADDGRELTADDLWQACRQLSGPQLSSLAQRLQPFYTWTDIVLPADLLAQLREIAGQVAHRHEVYENWGFGRVLSRGRGISALFAGPSGTGKTMAAEILANDLDLDLYRIDLSAVVSKYIGETEKNLKQVFDAAEQSGAILFFDEADALFGKRTEVKDSHDRYANIEVNYLLQRMEAYRGLAILATNRKSALDRAFMRRLRFLLDFPFPAFDDRLDIWQKMFPPEAPLADLDFPALARLEITGGNIRNISLNAAFLAAEAGEPIDMSHIMHAARREYGKVDKMMKPAEFGDYYQLLGS